METSSSSLSKYSPQTPQALPFILSQFLKMCLFIPRARISLVVPLVDWVKGLARAVLDAIAECIADAGRFASDTFLPSGEVKQPLVSLSTTKELGSHLAAVPCSALVEAADGLYLFKSRALGLYNYISSTVARWKRVVKFTCLWLLRRATSIAASPLVVLRTASRLVTSWRGSFGMQPALWKRFLWKNLRLGSLSARLQVDARSIHRAFFVTVVILCWVLSDRTLFNVHCRGDSPNNSPLSASSSLLLHQETSDEDALADEDTFIVPDETCEPGKCAAEDKGRQWASGFSWADDAEEEEAKRGEVVYFFPRKEEPACQSLYSIPEGVEDEAEEIMYFETFEEKGEQSSGNDSGDTTLCEIDPLVSGLLQEEELVIHEHETVLDGVHKEQHDFEITLVVASNVSDIALFEDDNDINVKLPVSSSIGSSLRSKAPVFVQEEGHVLTTKTPALGFLDAASNVSDIVLFGDDNDVIVKLPVPSSVGSGLRSQAPVFVPKQDFVMTTWAPDLGFHSEPVL